MRIQKMFERDIDRDINGVVKVAQQDDLAVKQELEEYVITRELAGHFADFYDAYERALDVPTEKIGVWISGFFGSGKSHFLKMLSYLLTNREVAGRHAVDYFEGKFEDPMMDARVRRCAAVPAQSILFNVDNKSVGPKDKDVIKRTFARVFYDALGFYGEDLKLARLEKFIDDRGKTEAFHQAFEEVNGEPWLDARPEYDFFSDDVIDALESAGVMSHDEAVRWFDGSETADISLELLTDQIRDYADAQAAAHNGQFRLLFMVDEIGQYLAGDVNLMLNLQTFVEELGTKCAGRVWVMVTSQEDIDSMVKVSGNDFSKIQGRFDTRLSLSSSSADEVIKRRILAKNQDAANLLRVQYQETSAILKNLFTFEKSTGDLQGYDSAGDFVETFPFVSYQFKLMQNVMGEIRKHGSSGKHLSSGERSMLSGFQEAAQRVEEKDENALVPFWMFYDTLQTFLEGHIRRVVDRAAKAAEHGNQGLETQDVNVLKLLFLLKWDSDVRTTVGNITTLMTDDVRTDRMVLREQVQASLDRLVKENYVGRNGEAYTFLTDDEQDVARQIAKMEPDTSRITKKISDVFYNNVFPNQKLRVGENDFPVEEWVDETRRTTGSLVLRVLTTLTDSTQLSRMALTLRSHNGQEAIVALSSEVDYYTPLYEAACIELYVNTMNVSALPKQLQDIIRGKNQERVALERRAAELIEDAVRKGGFYAAGEEVHSTGTQSARKLVEDCVERLVAGVYPKLDLIDFNYHSDADLRALLGGEKGLDGQERNARAVADMDAWLGSKQYQHLSVSMAEILGRYKEKPFGWREVDIAAVVATLLADGRARARYAGKTLPPDTPKLVDYLRKAKEAEKLVVERRVSVSDAKRGRAREAVVEFCRANDVPGKEDELAKRAWDLLGQRRDELQHLLDVDYRAGQYPGRDTVESAVSLVNGLLAVGQDPADLLNAIADAYDDVMDVTDDLEPVTGFFQGQRKLWDDARTLYVQLQSERDYLASDEEAMAHLSTIHDVLLMPAPYKRIKDLAPACQELREKHGAMLKARKNEMLDRVSAMYQDIRGYAEQNEASTTAINQREIERRQAVNDATSLTKLDALKATLDTDQSTFYYQVDSEVARRKRPATPSHGDAPSPAPEPSRKVIRKVERAVICPPKRLSGADEVDAYVEAMRAKLLEQLEGVDAIQIN